MHGADLNHPNLKGNRVSISWHTWAPLARSLICLLLVSLGLVTFTATALAQATRGDFRFQNTVTFTDVSSCTGLTGTGANTATTVGQFVDTGGTFHVHGTTVQVYRIDWSDGTYLLSRSPSHFEFNTNLLGQFVSTEAQQDRGTLYSSNGQVIGRQTVFTLSHMTWRDTNGNGQPDPGEVTAGVDQFRVNCP
jgi:hypothetical protein